MTYLHTNIWKCTSAIPRIQWKPKT